MAGLLERQYVGNSVSGRHMLDTGVIPFMFWLSDVEQLEKESQGEQLDTLSSL